MSLPSNKVIRWGILGTGWVARKIALSFQWVENAQLFAVGSRNINSARAFAQELNVPKAYGSYQELLEDSEVDVVFVATPQDRHLEDCLQCFAYGKAVMCEKPFAMNFAQAEKIIQAARNQQLFCMEAMWMRFFPAIQDAKRRVTDGEIGNVVRLRADLGYPTEFDPNNRFFSLARGGGALLDRGVYLLSLADYLLGKHDSLEVVADIGKTGVDETSSYLLLYPSGARANLSATLRGYGSNQAVIQGTKGTIKIYSPLLQSSRIGLFSRSMPPQQLDSPGPMPRYGRIRRRLQRWTPLTDRMQGAQLVPHPYPGMGYQFEINEATNCIRQGVIESSIMSLANTLNVMRTLDQIRGQLDLKFPTETVSH